MGKSFNANLLLYLHVLYGGYGLIFDPKGERTHWATDLKVFDGLITVVTLSADPAYRGKLDPFVIYRDDVPAACELALNVLAEYFMIKPSDDAYTALLDANQTCRDSLWGLWIAAGTWTGCISSASERA